MASVVEEVEAEVEVVLDLYMEAVAEVAEVHHKVYTDKMEVDRIFSLQITVCPCS